jgi:hypothetical protein
MNILQISEDIYMRTAADAEILEYCTKCLYERGRAFCHQVYCAMFSGPKADVDPETRIKREQAQLEKERRRLLSKMTAEQQLQYLIERCEVK